MKGINFESEDIDFGMNPNNFSSLKGSFANLASELVKSKIEDSIKNSLVNQKTRDSYLEGLSINKIDGDSALEVSLQGWLPNALEEGCSSFDMKVGFSKSQKIKYNKEGKWYLTIPFSSVNIGRVEQKENVSKTEKIPKIGETSASLAQKQMFKKAKKPTIPSPFVRVSENSDKNSFIPGVERKDILGKALIDIDAALSILSSKVVDDFLDDL